MRSRTIVIVSLAIVLVVAGAIYLTQRVTAGNGEFVLSGTIEVTETNLPTLSGGLVQKVYVNEGDQVQKDEPLVDLYSPSTQTNERVTSPIDGTVLQRLVEPDELAAAGSPVMVVAPLDMLYLNIYVPENRYSQVALGQTYPVSVDSFPGETFVGTVSFISDQAQFTPANVQTADRRQTTVYAVKLDLEPSGGKLKPGMPADVTFRVQG